MVGEAKEELPGLAPDEVPDEVPKQHFRGPAAAWKLMCNSETSI